MTETIRAEALAFLNQVFDSNKTGRPTTLREFAYISSIADSLGMGMRYFNLLVIEKKWDFEAIYDVFLTHKSFNQALFCRLMRSWYNPKDGGNIALAQITPAQTTPEIEHIDMPLSEADLNHWHENGYVIVREVITRDQAKEVAQWLLEDNGMSAHHPESWYQKQGPIMLETFQHPLLDLARHSTKARRAFEQLWGTKNLVCSVDFVSINPPENGKYCFQGPDLHLDVNFHHPMHFNTQGIVYLNNIEEHQGALTLCPGFHNNFLNWYDGFSQDENPHEYDYHQHETRSIAADAGDLIIWHHWLPHGASPNRANFPRLAQYMTMYSPEPQLVS
jgi:hypothetical protein